MGRLRIDPVAVFEGGSPGGAPCSFWRQTASGHALPAVRRRSAVFPHPRYVRVLARFEPLLWRVVPTLTVNFRRGSRRSVARLMLRPRIASLRLPFTNIRTFTTRAPRERVELN